MKIEWTSWNAIEDELMVKKENPLPESKDFEDQDQPEFQELLIPIFGGEEKIHTPFGAIDKQNYFKPSTLWDCWIARTDFKITHSVVKKILDTDGVAVLKVLDRYTFCIGVGKLFKSSSVLSAIDKALCVQKEINVSEILKQAISKISPEEYWLVYINKDSTPYVIQGTKEHINKLKSSMQLICDKMGGYIFEKETYEI